MTKASLPLLPAERRRIEALGSRLRLARLRRRLGTELFAERVGISRETLRRLEQGDSTIAMGTFLRALRVLGLDADIDVLARDDVLGRKLQDLGLEPGKAMRRPASRVLQTEAHKPAPEKIEAPMDVPAEYPAAIQTTEKSSNRRQSISSDDLMKLLNAAKPSSSGE